MFRRDVSDTFDHPELLRELRNLLVQVEFDHEVKPIQLIIGQRETKSNMSWGLAWTGLSTIELGVVDNPKDQWTNKCVLLHEVAHILSPRGVNHGVEMFDKMWELIATYLPDIPQADLDDYSQRESWYKSASIIARARTKRGQVRGPFLRLDLTWARLRVIEDVQGMYAKEDRLHFVETGLHHVLPDAEGGVWGHIRVADAAQLHVRIRDCMEHRLLQPKQFRSARHILRQLDGAHDNRNRWAAMNRAR